MTLHQEGGLSSKQPDVQRKAPGRDRSGAQKGGGRQQLTNTAGRGQAAWPQAGTLWSSLSEVKGTDELERKPKTEECAQCTDK